MSFEAPSSLQEGAFSYARVLISSWPKAIRIKRLRPIWCDAQNKLEINGRVTPASTLQRSGAVYLNEDYLFPINQVLVLSCKRMMPEITTPTSEKPATSGQEPLALDIQERVERLQHDLEHNPAIRCPITFNWHGNKELADTAAVRIRLYGLMMREERPEVSLDALQAITFHHDYELALQEATGKHGAGPTPTKEAGGFSVGMMVRAGERVHLVMHESVALALISDDQAQRDWAQHVVRHELCHVDDYAFKKALMAKHPDLVTFGGCDSHFAPLATTLWDEFFANKYSFGHWSDPRTFLDLLRDSLPGIRDEINDAILTYRTGSDLDGLLAFALPKVKFVAQCFGYAAGTLAAMNTTLADEAPNEHTMLATHGLIEAWQMCFDALLDLDATRPNWESVLDIGKLFQGCSALLAGFGFHFRPQGDAAYVDIPVTPETDPLQVILGRLAGSVKR
jgi:hypothetical protein